MLQLLGKRPEPCIFWHKGVQPLHAVTKILPSGSATRKMSRRRKDSMINMWEKWAWILLTPSFFNIRRSGTISQCGPQKNSLNDCPETWQDKQQDPPLDQTQTELLTSALSNYVPKGSIHHPATSPDTMDLAGHEGQVPLQWTEPTNIQTLCIIILYTFCISIWFIEWISISIKKKSTW